MNANQLYIGALNLSEYLTLVDTVNPQKWKMDCWNVPAYFCTGLLYSPALMPLFLRWRRDNKPFENCYEYQGFPQNVTGADFLFLEHAPYIELNYAFTAKFNKKYGVLYKFHIQTRLYLALEQGQ